jgi:hypothetical protein
LSCVPNVTGTNMNRGRQTQEGVPVQLSKTYHIRPI